MSAQEAMKSKRLAPPSLFVPPSRNISTTDLQLSRQTTRSSVTNRNPLLRQRSATAGDLPLSSSSEVSTAASPRQALPFAEQQAQSRPRRVSRTEQTWAELQNTLEEVELSAASVSNVFGAEHSRALEELRKAQVELARAWARGEEGEGLGDDTEEDEDLSGRGSGEKSAMGEKSAVLATERDSKVGAGTGKGTKPGVTKTQLEEETENDILLARKRRLANDKYFERVNKGVADVVAKLEIVADKMGGVELESQEIWGDRNSINS